MVRHPLRPLLQPRPEVLHKAHVVVVEDLVRLVAHLQDPVLMQMS